MIGMIKLTPTGGILDAAGNGPVLWVRPDFQAIVPHIAPHGEGAIVYIGGSSFTVRESLGEIERMRIACFKSQVVVGNATEDLTCVICGCDEYGACMTDEGACRWVSITPPVCSNPECVEAFKARR